MPTGISLVTTLFLISYSCTCRLVRSESGLGPILNGITYDKILVVASGANSLYVAWWSNDASSVARYSVLCSPFYVVINKTKIEQSVTDFIDDAINSLIVDNLVPLTAYNCCVTEYYSVDNGHREICKTAITLSQGKVCQQGSTGLSPIVGAAISLFVMLLMTLLCSSILFVVVIKQRKDGNKVQKWLRSIKATQHRLESHSHDNDYCNNGSVCIESDASTTANTVSVTAEGDYDIVTAECVAYSTNNLVDSNDNPEDSNEARNSEIYEAIS